MFQKNHKRFRSVLLGALILAGSSHVCLPQDAAPSGRASPMDQKWEFRLEIGAAPFQERWGSNSWVLKFNVRAGIGTAKGLLSYLVFVDYYQAKLAGWTGMTDLVSGSPVRHDIVLHGAVVLLRIFFVGLGTSYTTSETAMVRSRYGREEYPLGAKADFYFFYTFGLGYDIPIARKLSVPLGLYVINGHQKANYVMVTRAGIAIRF